MEVQQLYGALSAEFAHDTELASGERNLGAQLESVYSRALGISGPPLTDNFHFGQTLLNDYGRPYEQGFNAAVGASGWTTAGPFVVYARGEYQSAPSAPSPSTAALDFISSVDGLPPNPPQQPIAAISRFQLLDAYVGMNLANWQLSYGKRSLWWGPSEGGTMLFTNNAAPLNHMFSIDRVSPFRLPWIFGYLGDMRLSAFIGQLSGQEFSDGTLYAGRQSHDRGVRGGVASSAVSQRRKDQLQVHRKLRVHHVENDDLWRSRKSADDQDDSLQSTFGVHVNGDVLGDGRSAVDFQYRIPKTSQLVNPIWRGVYRR